VDDAGGTCNCRENHGSKLLDGEVVVRVLIVDPEGSSGLDLAVRAHAAGHQVKLAIKQTEKTKNIGRGLVEVIDDPRPAFTWAHLIVACDNNLYMQALDWHRQSGKTAVIAASQAAAEWEINREVGQKALQSCGIATIPSKTFHDYDQAIAHVKRTMQRYVSKPSGDGTADKSLSYVSSGPDDMVYMLERWKRSDKLKGSFILQEFVPGIECGVAGWIGPHGWNRGFEENFEFKKLMNGDIGVATGEQGTVMRYVAKSKLADKVLLPLTDKLLKMRYVGDVDVNCIIDEHGEPWPLEFTMRLGWPAFNLQVELLNGEDPVEWLYELAMGRDSRSIGLGTIAIGVVLSLPDYPYSHLTRKEVTGIPIYGIKPDLWRHIHPCEMMLGTAPWKCGGKIMQAPMPCTAGDYVLTMTAQGSSVQEARERVYARLGRLRIPGNPMWRTDIGSRLRWQLPRIQAHGYARSLLYSTPEPSSRRARISRSIA
jgi:phosphoribosylamine---glycine ligase